MTNPDDMNRTRAKRLGQVLREYGTDNTDRGCLIDLLTDARHWCDRHDEAFAELDRLAYQHYAAEVVESRRRS